MGALSHWTSGRIPQREGANDAAVARTSLMSPYWRGVGIIAARLHDDEVDINASLVAHLLSTRR